MATINDYMKIRSKLIGGIMGGAVAGRAGMVTGTLGGAAVGGSGGSTGSQIAPITRTEPDADQQYQRYIEELACKDVPGPHPYLIEDNSDFHEELL